MMTKKRVQELADKLNITISYEYNPARSRYEATIGTTHFRSLKEAYVYMVGL